MPFVIPQMPLLCQVWHNWVASAEKYTVPNMSNLPCNLSQGRRSLDVSSEPTKTIFGITCYGLVTELMVPKLTDIRGWISTPVLQDLIECPQGSKRLYSVLAVDDVGKGFANEYRLVLMCRVQQAMVFSDMTVAVPVPLP